MVYSASLGVIRIQEGEKGQERSVSLIIGSPDLLSPTGAARLKEMSFPQPRPYLVERVPVSALKATVGKALNLKPKPHEPAERPSTP
jgi:hypothetical protein